MPTPVMHLAMAEELLCKGDLVPEVRRLLTQQRGPFLLGNTAPDVQTVSGQARDETHFYSIPRTTDRPAYETLFAAHQTVAQAKLLPPPQVAFVAGYIAHLVLDELWLDDIFLRHFGGQQDWGTWPERSFLHNVLRTWMDRRDLQRLNGTVARALQTTEPRGWLPFAEDVHLLVWRDWLVEQLGSGRNLQTAEVFAQRMGVPVAEVEAVLRSPQQMDARVFSHTSLAELESFHDAGYERSVALVNWYVGRLVNPHKEDPL